jgi:hypothetical protein
MKLRRILAGVAGLSLLGTAPALADTGAAEPASPVSGGVATTAFTNGVTCAASVQARIGLYADMPGIEGDGEVACSAPVQRIRQTVEMIGSFGSETFEGDTVYGTPVARQSFRRIDRQQTARVRYCAYITVQGISFEKPLCASTLVDVVG